MQFPPGLGAFVFCLVFLIPGAHADRRLPVFAGDRVPAAVPWFTLAAAEPVSAAATECDQLAAIPLDPEKPVALRGAFALLDLGDSHTEDYFERAIQACREAVSKHPDTRRFKNQLVAALIMGKQFDAARKLLLQMVDAKSPSGMMLMGLMMMSTKDVAGGRRLMEPASLAGDPLATILLSLSYSGDDPKDAAKARLYFADALAQLEAARTRGDPDAPAALGVLYLGYVDQSIRDPARADALIAEAVLRKSQIGIGFFLQGSAEMSAEVRIQVEQFLADGGYDVGPVDGVIDEKTESALAAFEKNSADSVGTPGEAAGVPPGSGSTQH
jgi:hypothetical protein